MPTDDGLTFHAIIETTAGQRLTRETDNRRELLTWIDQHCAPDDRLVELGMTATGPAIRHMHAGLAFGARRMRDA